MEINRDLQPFLYPRAAEVGPVEANVFITEYDTCMCSNFLMFKPSNTMMPMVVAEYRLANGEFIPTTEVRPAFFADASVMTDEQFIQYVISNYPNFKNHEQFHHAYVHLSEEESITNARAEIASKDPMLWKSITSDPEIFANWQAFDKCVMQKLRAFFRENLDSHRISNPAGANKSKLFVQNMILSGGTIQGLADTYLQSHKESKWTGTEEEREFKKSRTRSFGLYMSHVFVMEFEAEKETVAMTNDTASLTKKEAVKEEDEEDGILNWGGEKRKKNLQEDVTEVNDTSVKRVRTANSYKEMIRIKRMRI